MANYCMARYRILYYCIIGYCVKERPWPSGAVREEGGTYPCLHQLPQRHHLHRQCHHHRHTRWQQHRLAHQQRRWPPQRLPFLIHPHQTLSTPPRTCISGTVKGWTLGRAEGPAPTVHRHFCCTWWGVHPDQPGAAHSWHWHSSAHYRQYPLYANDCAQIAASIHFVWDASNSPRKARWDCLRRGASCGAAWLRFWICMKLGNFNFMQIRAARIHAVTSQQTGRGRGPWRWPFWFITTMRAGARWSASQLVNTPPKRPSSQGGAMSRG